MFACASLLHLVYPTALAMPRTTATTQMRRYWRENRASATSDRAIHASGAPYTVYQNSADSPGLTSFIPSASLDSNLHVLTPASSISFQYLSPTSSRPLTFFVTQKVRREEEHARDEIQHEVRLEPLARQVRHERPELKTHVTKRSHGVTLRSVPARGGPTARHSPRPPRPEM